MKQIAIILLTFALFSCGKEPQETGSSNPQAAPQRTVRVSEEAALIRISGTIRSEDTAAIASRFGGYIQSVPAKVGMRVHKNQLLVLMDDRNLSAQSDRVSAMRLEAEQASEEAKNHLQAAKAQKELAISTFDRVQKLYEKQSASRQEMEEAQARRDSAEAAWNAAARRVEQTAARIQQLNSEEKDVSASLSYVRIAAPFDGIVTSVNIDPGEFVNPGQVLVIVEKPQAYQIVFMAGQDLLQTLREEMKIDVELDGHEDARLKATVIEISPSMDAGTKTFQVKANIDKKIQLRAGISATVILPQSTRKALWIAEDFVIRKAGIETVYVRQEERWERTLVRSGKTKDGQVEILSGIKAGEEIALFEDQQ